MPAGETVLKTVRRLGAFNSKVSLAMRNIAAAFLGVMTIVVLTQVFFRYVLNESLPWSEELSKAMMVWVAFLVAPWGYRMGLNVSIAVFADAFPARPRRILEISINVLVLWIVGVFFGESLDFVGRGMEAKAATLPMAMAWFYAIVPVAFAALFLVGLELILRNLGGLMIGGPEFDPPRPPPRLKA